MAHFQTADRQEFGAGLQLHPETAQIGVLPALWAACAEAGQGNDAPILATIIPPSLHTE
jgi:hypothetical protein